MKNKFLLFAFSCCMVIAPRVFSQWHVVCNTGNGFVDNFEVYNNELYATGFFQNICGTSTNYVARYDGSSWEPAGNGFPNAGHHLAVIDGDLYGVAYQPAIDSNWLYKFDGSNFIKFGEGVYLSNAVSGFSQTANLYHVIQYNNQLVVSGEFDRVGTKNISGIMRWNGTEWDSLAAGLSGNISGTAAVMYPHIMCVFGNDLIAGGNFLKAGTATVNGIARWNGTEWQAMGQGFNRTVYALAVYNGELYAAGDFTGSGSTALDYIAKWDGSNWVNPGFKLYYNSSSLYTFIHTLKVMDNKLMIAGGFNRVLQNNDTMAAYGIIAYNGSLIDTLMGGTSGREIEGIAYYNGQLYAGGGQNNSNTYVGRYTFPANAITTTDAYTRLDVFPNPSSSRVYVNCTYKIDAIEVCNILGQKVLELQPAALKTSFDMPGAGIYFISVYANNQLISRKIIIE